MSAYIVFPSDCSFFYYAFLIRMLDWFVFVYVRMHFSSILISMRLLWFSILTLGSFIPFHGRIIQGIERFDLFYFSKIPTSFPIDHNGSIRTHLQVTFITGHRYNRNCGVAIRRSRIFYGGEKIQENNKI